VSSACPRFNGGSWMLLMESNNERGAIEGAGDAGHINSMVIKMARVAYGIIMVIH